MRWLLPALVALLAGCARAAAPGVGSGAGPDALQLFLLAGQSNMAGRGEVEAQDRVPHPRIWMLDREGRWVPAVEPLHFDKPVAGVGPGLAFARALAEADPEIRIGLVPAAVGGSSVTAWRPGAVHDQTGAHPLDDALARARIAAPAGRWRAILWHQGESDSNPTGAPPYAARLEELFTHLRAELGRPDLPILVGRLPRFQDRPWNEWREQVDRTHLALPTRLPNVAVVSTDGLVHNGDSIHFDAASARELGRRYAEAWWSCRLPGTGCQLPAASYQLPVTSYQ